MWHIRTSFFKTALIVAGFSWCANAAPPPADCQASGEKGRVLLVEILRYSGVEQQPADGLLDRLTASWCKAQEPALKLEDRQQSIREMYGVLAEVRGQPLSNPRVINSLAGMAANAIQNGGRMDLELPVRRGPIGAAQLGIQKYGSGSIPVLMIADLGVDGRQMYRSFVERNGHKYSMVVITLPGAGSAPQLPWPEHLDYSATPWLNAIEHALANYLGTWKKPVVLVGTAAGGYFAARLALERPRSVRAAVLVNALVNVPLRSRSSPDAPAPLTERISLVRSRVSAPQFFPAADTPPRSEIERLLSDPSSKNPTVRNWMAYAVKNEPLSKRLTADALTSGFFLPGIRYGAELMATDLAEPLKGLKTPMLVMASFYDDGSPAQGSPTVAQWEEVKLRYPQVPLATVSFADARAYLSEDSPAEFDRDFDAFLHGRRAVGTSTWVHQARPSPRASAMQAIGKTEIQIDYSRPAVKGRKIWGEVVPFGRVWRTGANEATTIRFTTPVTIDGHPLAAGRYSLFTIPAEDGTWTVIFNKIANQWGAFNYNAEFDTLRLTGKARDSVPVEYLRFTIDAQSATGAVVTLAWGERSMSFVVDTSQ